MKTRLMIVVAGLTLAVSAVPAPAAERKPARAVLAASEEYEAKVTSLLREKKYLEAIGAVADYEQALAAAYAPPRFRQGTFESEGDHLRFVSPFEGWSALGPKELSLPDWLPGLGVRGLLVLKGPAETERLLLLALDVGRLMKKIDKGAGQAGPTDLQLKMFMRTMSQQFGQVTKEQFQTLGDRRVLRLELQTAAGQPGLLLCLPRDGHLYTFLLTSAEENFARNEGWLEEVVRTLDVHFKPSDPKKVQAARRKVTDSRDVPQVLRCVRELAAAGEYGAAGEELVGMTTVIADKMPAPVVQGATGRYDAYGITLTNPDPERWKFSANNSGAMGMLILEDRTSVTPVAVMVGVINTVVAYGPQAARAVGDTADEEQSKGLLSGAGRGGLLNMGGEIKSERFRKFHGFLAYEGVATCRLPDTKAKVLVAQRPGHLLMVILLVKASDYEAQAAEMEKILAEQLELKAADALAEQP
jgi:hypothetical protein